MVIDKHFSGFTSNGCGVRYVGFTGAFTQSGVLTQVRFRRYYYTTKTLNTTDIKIVVFDSSRKVKSINTTTFSGALGDEIATSTAVNIPISSGDGILLWESGETSNAALSAATSNLISGGFLCDSQVSFSVGSTVDVSNTVGQPGIELTVSDGGGAIKNQAQTGGL